MSRFKDTFDATRGDEVAARKLFDEVAKRANAAADQGRKLLRAKTTEDVPRRSMVDGQVR